MSLFGSQLVKLSLKLLHLVSRATLHITMNQVVVLAEKLSLLLEHLVQGLRETRYARGKACGHPNYMRFWCNIE